jgi:4'-phosphopantetheinyl transferase
VHVHRIALDLPADAIEEARATISVEERARADRFRFPRDRDRFTAARAALRRLLALYLNADPRRLRFALGPYGKPELEGEEGDEALRFNLSHSDALALCAVTRARAVGVDLERIRARIDEVEIAERYFSRREVEQLRAVPPQLRSAAFFRCWTRKEAYIKARGEGLSHPLAQFSVSFGEGEPPALFGTEPEVSPLAGWTLAALEPGSDYVGALVAAGTDWTLRFWEEQAP